jgi:hypothetical protein
MDRKHAIPLILWLYDQLRWLYPPGFRAQFADEQHQVFEQSLQAGEVPPGKLLLRELVQLPRVLLRCHWAALCEGGWRDLLQGAALLIVFLLPALTALNELGIVLANGIGYAILIGLAVALLTGAALGFPRWVLPYGGLILAFLSLPVENALVNQIGRLLPRHDYSTLPLLPRLGLTIMWEGVAQTWLLGWSLACLSSCVCCPNGCPAGPKAGSARAAGVRWLS